MFCKTKEFIEVFLPKLNIFSVIFNICRAILLCLNRLNGPRDQKLVKVV